MVGADNQDTYDYPGNTIDPDGIAELSFVNLGRKLFLAMRCRDGYLTSADVRGDSDGLSHLWIRDAANASTLHDISYTFFSDGGQPVTGPTLGGALAALPAGNAAFSLLPGTNTIDRKGDTDPATRWNCV